MGCRRYSATSRLEVLLDEDDFRSFWRALELGNVLLLSQLHVTILVLWSQCRAPPPWWTLVHQRVSPFLFDLLLQFLRGIDTQLWVDFNPPTGLPVLVECLVSSWPNKMSFSISLVDSCPPTGLPVLDDWVFGFGWIRWVSLLLPATSESNSFIQLSLEEIVGGGRGDTNTFSFYNKLGVCRKGRLHYILFDRISILFVEQAVYRPSTLCPGVFSTSFCLYDARRAVVKSSSCGSLCSSFMGFTAVKNTVCLSLLEFCPPAINPEFVMDCKLIAHPMW